ncbi:Signal transducer regulating beta-lactamase production, contains metallopeptidase domain [Prosthecobacter debontii]|uniref:Signal transducer regulating beta-lactamase production, contains metallopeptidase domain n=1 Tax=Prosthecobacter debontii TaxID=48467 RepID=A0A1T4X9T5_9BACT|nr:M56 family metallopeptidase [Prosthecobacter debontii]SKA86197.1 Signal transducer regulating beta-lactamase production, contains metallopeptidase domain [Prosthecobacter debontii]
MKTLHLLFDWTLDTSLRATLLVVLVMTLQTLLRHRLSCRWRYALWLPVLAVLLMPIFLPSAWSLESLLAPSRSVPTASAQVQTMEQGSQDTGLKTGLSNPLITVPAPLFDWSQVGMWVWLSGVVVLLSGGLLSYLRTLHLARNQASPPDEALLTEIRQIAGEAKLSRLPDIVVSPEIQSPAVTGLWRSVLMLPKSFGDPLNAEETRLVLKHELMHLKRGDLRINFLLCLLLALHWFNPLLWFAFFKARTDREAACDEQVLQGETSARRHAYGSALLKMESAFPTHGLCVGFVGIFQRGSALRTRIQAIASARTAAPLLRVFLWLAIPAMTFLGVTRAQTPIAQTDTPGFEVGSSNFKSGDEIRIFKVDRNADRMIITGAYELGSEESAILLLSITRLNTGSPKVAFDPRQQVTVQRGQGSFTLTFPNPYPGLPHVTFYQPAQPGATNSAFGGIYFGTSEEAKASRKLDLSYMTAQVGGSGNSGDPKKTLPPRNSYLVRKLERIVFPQVQFSSVTLKEVVDFLEVQSRELDTLETNPKLRGVHFLLRQGTGTEATLSLDLKQVPLMDVLRYVTELAGVKFRVEPYAVLIEPLSDSSTAVASSPDQARALTGNPLKYGPKIILPQVHFRDATLEEALELIRVQVTTACDRMEIAPLNIVLKPGAPNKARITLDLKDVPLVEALRYVAELAHHSLRSDEHAFILEPRVSKASKN